MEGTEIWISFRRVWISIPPDFDFVPAGFDFVPTDFEFLPRVLEVGKGRGLPLRLLGCFVAAARRKTTVFLRPMAPRNTETVQLYRNLAAQARYLFARRFAGSGMRVLRHRAVRILTPDDAFLPGGLQGPFGERACGLLGLELF